MNPNANISLIDAARMMISEMERGLAPPSNTSCRAGCGACCRQLVTISPAEALRISALVDAMEEPRRSEIWRRFDEAGCVLHQSGITAALDQLADPDCPPERHHQIARDYFLLQLACPFLENESCSIHADRPLICREYHVSSPPAHCSEPFEKDVEVIPAPVRHDEALKLLCAHLTGGEVTPVPLALALEHARRNAKLGGTRFDESKVRTLISQYLDICRRPLKEGGAAGIVE